MVRAKGVNASLVQGKVCSEHLAVQRGGNFSSEMWGIFCREKDGGCFLLSGNDSAVLRELNPKHHALSVTPSAKSQQQNLANLLQKFQWKEVFSEQKWHFQLNTLNTFSCFLQKITISIVLVNLLKPKAFQLKCEKKPVQLFLLIEKQSNKTFASNQIYCLLKKSSLQPSGN